MKRMTDEEIERWIDEASDGTYAECEIMWLDDKTGGRATIKLNNEVNDDEDALIFFYCANVQEFAELFDPDNGEEFYITDVYDVY